MLSLRSTLPFARILIHPKSYYHSEGVKRMKKRILSILLVALMVMSVLPLSAFATSDSDAELGDVVYGHYDNGT